MYKPAGTFSVTYNDEVAVIQQREHWILIGLLLAFMIFGLGLAGNYLLGIINLILITVISLIGLQVLTGFTGQISVSHAAFMAVGAYTSAILSTKGVPVMLSIIVAGLATGCLGLLIGWPSVRIKGFYLLMTTFAAQVIIIWAIKTPLGFITRGSQGHSASSPQLFGYMLNTERSWFLFLAIILCLVTI
ncbi:MAG: branched-chain amino acid ABC transporter permease, partial [Desulfofustis sp.]|nr:branched-chain amino acid ABC transporter permease [Desulfofustis sp.]